MPEIYTTRFKAESGKTVELPSKVGRKDIGRYGGGAYGDGTLQVAIVGTGEIDEYVVLEVSEGHSTIPDGAEIIGTDVASGATYYAVPREVYRE